MNTPGPIIVITGRSNTDLSARLRSIGAGDLLIGSRPFMIINSSPLDFVRRQLDMHEPAVVLINEPWPAISEALPALAAEHPETLFVVARGEPEAEVMSR